MRHDQSDFPNQPAHHHIAVLVAVLLEPAKAGGMSDRESRRVYDAIMSRIASLGPDAFEMLREDILKCWARPLLTPHPAPKAK
ncbi:MAG: hypothetical protein ACOZNI_20130 [Myxococcota bacterium]